jgi:hypothetical protein
VTDADADKLPKYDPLPAPNKKAMELRSARSSTLKALKFLGAWLKNAGAPAAEVDALRGAWKAIPPPD